jgi:UDP-N-acetylmuramoyl-tripeptide--D-alanyl-D-alanine ligase
MDIQQLYAVFQANPIICTDSRKVVKGCIYWALKGDNFDGNTFAVQALEAGAAYAVVDNPELAKDNSRIILVDDGLVALQLLARKHRDQFAIPVIGITGSNGKTTTKELMQCCAFATV